MWPGKLDRFCNKNDNMSDNNVNRGIVQIIFLGPKIVTLKIIVLPVHLHLPVMNVFSTVNRIGSSN